MLDSSKLGILVRQIRIVLLLPLLLASVSVLAQAPRLTLSVDQGVPSGELRLVRKSAASGSSRNLGGHAVSPDGRWLFYAGSNLEVWEIDSARGIVTQRMSSPQSGFFSFLAVSRDSSLVFVLNRQNNQITVFRLNADDGRLEEVAKYTEGGTDAAGNTVRGLTNASDVVPSPDGRLLFVTSGGDSGTTGGALSVWSVNSTSTLTQTDVHVSAGASDTEGLENAAGAAVTPDGRLLFVGSSHNLDSLDNSTLGIWRVNADASTVSFVRTLSDRRMLRRPRVVTLGPAGRFLFVSSRVSADAATDPLSVYEVNAAEENLASVASYGEDDDILGNTIGLAATREVLAVAEFDQGSIALWQRNDDGTLRFASRHDSASSTGLAASPAGGLVFVNSYQERFITVLQVLGIPRVPAGQEVRVMVNAESALGSALTVMVQARQGSRVSMAAATLMPSDTQAEAVFSGSDLGQGEWIFSASVPADMADVADVSTARATLRIGGPLVRLENLSGAIPEGADLNIRVSTEGAPVLGDAEVTLRAAQEGARPRTVMGLLREGQTSVTVTFAGRGSLTLGDWVLSASSILSTDENSTLAVTVGPPLPRLTLSVDQGVPSGELRLRRSSAVRTNLIGSKRLAVSPDGRWLLASTSFRITLREIDSARGIVARRMSSASPGASRGLAVSPDSSLVFVPNESNNQITVFRLNADEGRLEEVAKYTEGGEDAARNRISGLANADDVVPSPDGRLLFVTSRGAANALSVWNVNPSGTLVQTDVHVFAGALGNQAAGAAVTPDGRLLFVGGAGTLSIWRVNAEASTVSFVRTLSDRRRLRRPSVVTLGPAGRFLFVSSQFAADSATDPLSVYEVNAEEENLASLASYGDDIEGSARGLAATREVLAVAEFKLSQGSIALWQRNASGTLSFVSRHDSRLPVDLAASPAGGLVFISSNRSSEGISVWQVQGIPRVPAGQEVRVMVNAEPAPDSALTVTVQARQGSRVSTAEATLMPSGTLAVAEFPGSDLGPGEWIFSASVSADMPADMADVADVSAARATLRISGPLIRLENLSGEILQGADLNIRVSTEGMVPVAGNAEVTLRATQEGAQPRMVVGLLRKGQISFTVTFAGGSVLTAGDWVLSAESSIPLLRTDSSSFLVVTVRPPPLIRLENLSGEILQGADLNIRVSTEGMVPVAGNAEVTLQATQEGAQPQTVMGLLREGQTSVTVTFAGEKALTEGDWILSAESSILLSTDANSTFAVTVGPPLPRLTLSVDQGVPSGEMRLVQTDATSLLDSLIFTGGLVAVSPDGRWLLASGGGRITLREIDSARGIVTPVATYRGAGLGGNSLAVSRDSSLVFTSDRNTSTSTISVWRLDADDGRLEEVAKYTEGGTDAAGNTVRGLIFTHGVVLSPDDRLLFVTSRGEPDSAGGALSVWSVNPSGTLVQTDVHISAGASDTEGLNRAAGAAVTPDGRLLFVGSFYDSDSLDSSTLGIWRVNAEASTVSFVRTLSDRRMLRRPRVVTLGPDGRFLFVSSQVDNDAAIDPLSVYEVNAAEENLASVASYGDDISGDTIGLAATREVLAVAESSLDGVALWQRNDNGTLSFASRHDSASPAGLAASPAGGLVFSGSSDRSVGITVWQVQGIPRVPAGQEVRVMVNAEPAPDSALTVMVQARQGSRVRMAAATLMPSDTQAEAVFSGSALGQGEWIFSASVPADMADRADRTALSAARATLRIGGPLIRLSNLSGVILQGADLNIRVSTEGHPVLEDAEVTLRATQEGARPRMVVGLLRKGQISFTVTFAGGSVLTAGDWVLSAESSIPLLRTDSSSFLVVTVRPPPLIRLENLSGAIPKGADLNIRVSTEGMVPVAGNAEVTLQATQEGAQPQTVMGLLREGQTSVTVTFAGEKALTEGDWILSAESSILLGTDANSMLAVTVRLPRLTLSVDQGVPSGEMRLVQTDVNTDLMSRSVYPEGLTVSPDGRWLLASGGGITVWEIDSVRGIVTTVETYRGTGLGGNGLAVSRDSSLVFTSHGASISTISVWRLDADDGSLAEVAQYTEGGEDAAGNIVRGLTFTHDVVLSPDDRLLFVTSRGEPDSAGGALSVWSVNSSGTLVQTDVHVSAGASDTEGLNRAAGAAVTPDGGLLFVGSDYDDQQLDKSTLSIWRVRVNAETSTATVSFVRTLSDERMLSRPWVVTLGPSGSFLFVSSQIVDADAETDLLSVYEVNAAEENLASVASYGEDDILRAAFGLAATREVLAVAELSQGSVSLWRRNNDGTLRFASRHASDIPFDLVASPAGGLVFSSSFGDAGSVWQVQGIPRVPAGQEVRVMVNAESALDSALTVMVQARQGSRVSTAAATLMPSDTQAEAVFSGSTLGQGEWIFSASVPADMADVADVSAARATLRIGSPLVRLENLSGAIREGADLNIRISTEGHPVLEDAQVTLRATQEGARPRTVMGLLREGQTSVTVTFAGEKALTQGVWIVSAETSSTLLQTDANSTLAVTVGPPLPKLTFSLQETAEPVVPAGSTLEVTVMADRPLLQTLTVTVQAVRTVTAPPTVTTATVTTQLFAQEQVGRALFEGENTLSPGQWVLTIAKVLPENSAEASTQQLQVRVGSSALGLSAPMGLFQGRDAVIEVNTEVALGVEVRVMVMATHAEAPATTASAAAVLGPSALAAEARFPADMLSLVREGTWDFEITAATPSVLMIDTEAFPLVDFTEASATLQVTEEPTLLLELTGGSAIVASDGMITLILRVMPALSSTVMVTVAVTDEDNNTISEQQEALSSSLRLTFRASDLGTGRLRFTARGPAGVLEDSEAEVTVLVATAAGVVLSANPEGDVFPGDEVRLSAAVLSGPDPAGIDVVLEVAVTDPDGSTRSNVLIPVSAETSTGGLTFIPDAVPGTWNFNVIESDMVSASMILTVVVAAVMPLDFNDPSDEVSADDLVLLLRYERLCAEGSSPPLPASCTDLGSEALAAGLALESSPDRLADLQNVRLPDVTGTGVGSVQTLTILLQALANVQDELLLPAAASSLPETTIAEAEQARDARLRIIRQLLGRE